MTTAQSLPDRVARNVLSNQEAARVANVLDAVLTAYELGKLPPELEGAVEELVRVRNA